MPVDGSARGRLAILGAGGFLGSHLTAALLERGHEVEAVDVDFSKLDLRHPRLDRVQARLSEPLIAEVVGRSATVLSHDSCWR